MPPPTQDEPTSGSVAPQENGKSEESPKVDTTIKHMTSANGLFKKSSKRVTLPLWLGRMVNEDSAKPAIARRHGADGDDDAAAGEIKEDGEPASPSAARNTIKHWQSVSSLKPGIRPELLSTMTLKEGSRWSQVHVAHANNMLRLHSQVIRFDPHAMKERSLKVARPDQFIQLTEDEALGITPEQEDAIDVYIDSRFQAKAMLDSPAVEMFTMFITIIALFLSDIALLAFPPTCDPYIDHTLVGIFCLFAVELLLNLFIHWRNLRDYLLNVYFWLDFIATISIILDVSYLSREIFPKEFVAARAGRAARAGSKAGRLIKLVRLMRLSRLMRLGKVFKQARRLQNQRKASIMTLQKRKISESMFNGSGLNASTKQKILQAAHKVKPHPPPTDEEQPPSPTPAPSIEPVQRQLLSPNPDPERKEGEPIRTSTPRGGSGRSQGTVKSAIVVAATTAGTAASMGLGDETMPSLRAARRSRHSIVNALDHSLESQGEEDEPEEVEVAGRDISMLSISAMLLDTTIGKLIVGVLLLLFTQSILKVETTEVSAQQAGLDQMKRLYSAGYYNATQELAKIYASHHERNLLLLRLPEQQIIVERRENLREAQMRPLEIDKYWAVTDDEFHAQFWLRDEQREISKMQLWQTSIVILLLGVGFAVFSHTFKVLDAELGKPLKVITAHMQDITNMNMKRAVRDAFANVLPSSTLLTPMNHNASCRSNLLHQTFVRSKTSRRTACA